MKPEPNHTTTTPLNPPAAETSPNRQYQDWFPLASPDPVTDYLAETFWDGVGRPGSWKAARLSAAAYIYREASTGWEIAIKFYAPKTGEEAPHYAEREYQRTRQAWEFLSPEEPIRSVQPLGLWSGLLFLEFVRGLTLGDKIAIRRSQPGELLQAIETAGRLLARLHQNSLQPETEGDFKAAAAYGGKLVDNLTKHGVLQDHPRVGNGLMRMFESWAEDPVMGNFQLALNHGDATTSNFVIPPVGGMVAIDWERSSLDDPAADLGRLMAEITHSVDQQGGDFEEGRSFGDHLASAYCAELPNGWDTDRLQHRTRFYHATSTLRIARNGWLSRRERLALILEAYALLTG